jgi:gliding motility-associated-like protein
MVIDAAPNAPAMATVTLTQPTCDVSTGSIVIVSPIGTNLSYSIDGMTFQSNTIFDNLAAGTHQVTVRNSVGCISLSSGFVIHSIPVTPAVAQLTVFDTSCTLSTGSITVTAPSGSGLTYSIDGITFQASPVFSGLGAGKYSVTIKNTANCISVSPNIIINPTPATPLAVTATVTQPDCKVSTGVIIVRDPWGKDLTYSLDGINFQNNRRFDDLKSGTYKVYVKNSGGCISISSDITIQTPPNKLPTLDVSLLEGCDDYGKNDGFRVFDLTQIENSIPNRNIFNLTYHYNEADANIGADHIVDPSNFENTQPYAQSIWLRISNSNMTNCYNVERIEVKVENVPDPIIKGGVICSDYISGAIIKPLLIETGLKESDYNFRWFLDGVFLPSETNPSLFASKPGQYMVEIVSKNGYACIASSGEAATVFQSSMAIPVGKGYVVKNASGGKRTITAKVEGYGQYQFRIDNGLWQDSPVFNNVASGNHVLAVRDINPDACNELTIYIENQIDYPNFFTPNGDGYNDTWNINNLRNSDAVIVIYDRYGKIIKEITGNSRGWDGTFKGNPLPATDYWFKVIYPEFDGKTTVIKEFRAHFSLKR